MKKKLWLFWLRKLLRSFFASATREQQQLQHNKIEKYDDTDVNEAENFLETASRVDEIIRLRNQVSDLEEEHVRLREENYRLREELAVLRSRHASFQGGLDDLKRRVDQRKTDRIETVRFRKETERIRAESVQYRVETARLQRDRDDMWVIIVVNILSKLVTFL